MKTGADHARAYRTRKAEKVARMEADLAKETALLDQMVFMHPDTYRQITENDGDYQFRPGVARLELRGRSL